MIILQLDVSLPEGNPPKKDADVLVNGHMLGEDLLLPISGFFHGETEIPRTKRRFQ